MKDRIKELQKERGSRYGEFSKLADISQSLKDLWYTEANIKFKEPTEAMNEAMEMVLHKLARMINGDRYYLDNIDDIQSYLELYRQEVIKSNTNEPKKENNQTESRIEHLSPMFDKFHKQLNNILNKDCKNDRFINDNEEYKQYKIDKEKEALGKLIESITGEKIDPEKDVKVYRTEEEFIDELVDSLYTEYMEQKEEEMKVIKELLDEMSSEYNFN